MREWHRWKQDRKRINRNDGHWFRVDNEILEWYQVVGGLGFIAGILYLEINTLGAVSPRLPGWAAMVVGGIVLSAPWKAAQRVPDVLEDHGDPGDR